MSGVAGEFDPTGEGVDYRTVPYALIRPRREARARLKIETISAVQLGEDRRDCSLRALDRNECRSDCRQQYQSLDTASWRAALASDVRLRVATIQASAHAAVAYWAIWRN